MKTQKKCRICKGENLKVFFDLGETPLANSFLREVDLAKSESKYPLRVLFCEDCNLCQLGEVVSPEVLFKNYVYFSSSMPRLSEHFKNYTNDVYERFITSKDNLVVEIGSNDGILLSAFKNRSVRILGIDPAQNIASVANERGIPTVAKFFSENLAKEIVKTHGQAKALIGNNVVAHIDDHHDLVRGAKVLLEKDGVFVFEAPYLVDMFENFTFDTIYHEHLSYLAVRPLIKLFEPYGMEIFDVQTHPVQGVSLRVFAGNKGRHRILKSVQAFAKRELEMKMESFSTYLKLAKKIAAMKEDLRSLLISLKSKGKTIAAYGAPAKGNTRLKYWGIGECLDYSTYELPSKIVDVTSGTHLKVLDIKEARKAPPDYFLLLAWNYKEAILNKEREFRTKGGKFIMPVGRVEII